MKTNLNLRLFSPHLLSILTILTTGHLLSGSVLIDDDFEEYAAGGPPTSPWTSSSNITVSSNVNAQSTFGPSGDTQGMRSRNLNGSFTPEASVEIDSSGESYSILKIQFDYMFVTQQGNPQFILEGDNGTNGIRMMLTTTNGYVSVREGNSFNELTGGMSLSANNWYRFTQSIDIGSSTFSLTVEEFGGTTVTTPDLSFENSISNPTEAVFNYNAPISSTGGEYFIDNVFIETIPEPGSASLYLGVMSVIVVTFLRRRNHR
ncbi:hypothetical protein [Puniceicoccus vermicola]|uniref:Uncharacterized protein n=1 Tax=Puniceicoccus vermicola TaxID=388746 RepID=A0A7X1E779_9BACT|nr:hypothetical protein [Puniceicoccus vermicola]MBC2603442.1 hypothetical protein [Puniceicoccus vermicola]